ncbi:hypothetical protein [Bradyrhizobium sp. th.b2]|uniref:hypothetical protein n=1 Tax=Bradyrhizobium sp. th-b2 TaxID=172088 RepID=UPI0004006199|nr:hypothetical protein [Bradyrhizobium sp. th.b2]
MNPTANDPFLYGSLPDRLAQEQPQPQQQLLQQAAIEAPAPLTQAAFGSPLNGEVLPPEQPAAETPPTPPQYPIGLIDFNQPIAIVDADNSYTEDVFDNPQILTVLKCSVHPVVISFWKHGEQCIAQFDTDGDSSCGNYKVEQDLIYPATRYVVVGRDGRSLKVDEELYVTEEAARNETAIDDIAGVFQVVIEAPAPTLAQNVAGAETHVGDEAEEDENETVVAAAPVAAPVTAALDAPTEMYVAGRMRKVGETVHAYRNGFGTRICTILKLRRASRKSLYVDPKDGNEPYWALNKNVRY